jgi:hypothetical protein
MGISHPSIEKIIETHWIVDWECYICGINGELLKVCVRIIIT